MNDLENRIVNSMSEKTREEWIGFGLNPSDILTHVRTTIFVLDWLEKNSDLKLSEYNIFEYYKDATPLAMHESPFDTAYDLACLPHKERTKYFSIMMKDITNI